MIRLNPQAAPELVVSGNGIVGLAFSRHRSMILATTNSLIELFVEIEGKPLLQ